MSTVEFQKFIEEGKRLEQAIKSGLGRIRKTLADIDDFLSYCLI